MAQNYDMDALFHPKVELGTEKVSKTNAGEYSPTADKGQNGIYKSIIRFVSWWQDPQHSISDKWVCWLVDPVTNRGKLVDCPSSVGKPSSLQDMFFKLRKSESVQEQKKSEIFSRKHQSTAIIQVIQDAQNKEAEGKLLIYRFGKKISEKIEAEKKPVYGEPHEPFDLLDGKAFALIITKVSGFNNYDQSKLLPMDKDAKVVPFGTEGLKLYPINERTPREIVFNFLKDNSPDLGKYAFQEWDQETREYVNQVILAVTGQIPSTGFADVRNNKTNSSQTPVTPQKTGSGITSSELSLEDLDNSSSIGSSLPNLDLPELNTGNDFGLPGDLNDALGNL